MKKFIKYFILVLSICSILTLSVSANATENNANTKIITCGSPLTLYSSVKYDDSMHAVVNPNVNVYVSAGAGYTPLWKESIDNQQFCQFTYNNTMTGSADIIQTFTNPVVINGIAMYEPMFFDVDNYTNNNIYANQIGIYKPYIYVDGAPPVYKNSIKAEYSYLVAKATYDGSGSISGYYSEYYYFEHEALVTDNYARIYNYYDAHINTIANDAGALWDANGVPTVWILSCAIGLDNVATEQIFYENYPNNERTLYVDYLSHIRSKELSILNGSSILDIDNFDFLTWLSNSVKSFMDFEIIPGLSFAGILAVLLGIPLLVWFLRLFAGG